MTTRLIARSALGLFALALVAAGSIVSAAPAEARVFVGFGFGPFWGFPYPYYPYPYYPAPYYAPPVVYSPGYAPPDPGDLVLLRQSARLLPLCAAMQYRLASGAGDAATAIKQASEIRRDSI